MVSVEGISEDNQSVLEDLSWAIEADLGQFSLKLAHCNYQSLQAQIIEQLYNTFFVPIQLLKLESTDTTLYTTIQNRLESAEHPAALIVTGLESVKDLDRLLRATNQVRDEFRKNFHFPIILWINDRVLQKLQEFAPDFTNWSPSSFRFTLGDSDVLADVIQQKVDIIFNRILEIDDKQFLTNEDILGSNYYEELQSAQRDLSSLKDKLSAEFKASLDFIAGREDYIRSNFKAALAKYQDSLSFWQSEQEKPALKTAIIFFSVGLSYHKIALTDESNSQKYWQDARQVLEQCITIFQQAQRQDLVAKFINSLGEVLINLSAWSDLQKLAITSIQLQEEYREPTCLAQAYGFLGEFYLEQAQYQDAYQAAQSALKAIKPLSDQEKGLYWLLSAISQSKLGKYDLAVKAHQQANKINTHNQYLTYLRLLDKLRCSYWSNKQYVEAYQTKQEQQNLKQEYCLTAFIGASRFKFFESAQAFGRQSDINNLIGRIATDVHKLTIIYGQSGVGKSSLVEAGLLPSLKRKGRIGRRDLITLNLRVYSNWEKELGKYLVDELSEAETRFKKELKLSNQLSSSEDILKQLKHNNDNYLLTVLIFDQFEEFFFEHKTTANKKPFFEFLAQCLRTGFVKVIFSLREDYLYLLLQSSRYVNLSAINNNVLDKEILYYIGNFSSEVTKSIIENLTERSKFYLEPALVNELVEDLAGEIGEVRPIELQVVGAQLQTEHITTLEQYRQLGDKPKETLVQHYLQEVIADCGAENQQTAEFVMYLLTAENNTRPLKTRAELKNELKDLPIEEGKLDLVLDIFVKSGLIFELPEILANRYQLVHDYLVVFIRRKQEDKLIKLRAELQTEINQRKRIEKRFQLFWKGTAIFSSALVVLLVHSMISSQENARKFLKGEIDALINSAEIVVSETNKNSLEPLFAALKVPNKLNQVKWSISKLDSPSKDKLLTSLQQAVYWVREKKNLSGKHTQGIFDVSFSPDGQIIATASGDRTVKLWNQNGKITTLNGHRDIVRSVSFSPDGQIIATASGDRTVKLWNPEDKKDKKLIKTFIDSSLNQSDCENYKEVSHCQEVTSVSFSPDGNTLATASKDQTVKLWNLDGNLIKTFIDSSLKQSDCENYKEVSHCDEVWDVGFSFDNKTIATGSRDKKVKLWNRDGKLIKTLKGHTDGILSLSLSRDGILATGGYDKIVNLWDISNGQLLDTLSGHRLDILSLSFSPNGQILASGSFDKTVKLWEVKPKRLYSLIGHIDQVFDVSFSPNGKIVATASRDKTVKLWDRNGKFLADLTDHNAPVWSVDFSHDSQIIATASNDGELKFWNKQDGKWTINNTYKKHQSGIIDVSFSSNSQIIATASADHTTKLWEKKDGEWIVVQTLNGKGHESEVHSVEFHPSEKTLATASNDATVKLWEKQKGKWKLVQTLNEEKYTHTSIVETVSFSHDGKTMATASHDSTVNLWEKQKGKWTLVQTLNEEKYKGHSDAVWDVSFNHDDTMMGTSSRDGLIKLWEKQKGEWKLVQTLAGHNDGVWGISFDPDNKFLASASVDQRVLLWDLDHIGDLNNLLKTGCDWIREEYSLLNNNVENSEREIQNFCERMF